MAVTITERAAQEVRRVVSEQNMPAETVLRIGSLLLVKQTFLIWYFADECPVDSIISPPPLRDEGETMDTPKFFSGP